MNAALAGIFDRRNHFFDKFAALVTSTISNKIIDRAILYALQEFFLL